MKRGVSQPNRRAFTLLELLMVIAIIALLAVMLLPALARAKAQSKVVACASQLRQVGLGFHAFAHDHDGHFPMDAPTNTGGSLEFAQAGASLGGPFYFAFRHFQVLSNDLVTPRLLVCPADFLREPVPDFASLRNEHVSYFVGVNAEFAKPGSLLAGDRNLRRADSGMDWMIRAGTNAPLVWTRSLHEDRGNLLFADGRVETLTSVGVQTAFQSSPLPVTTLLPPVEAPRVTPLASGAAAGAPGPGSSSRGELPRLGQFSKSAALPSPGAASEEHASVVLRPAAAAAEPGPEETDPGFEDSLPIEFGQIARQASSQVGLWLLLLLALLLAALAEALRRRLGNRVRSGR
jgi:prepilin-type N-terminal cleavage/methylation domain-containing protein/prepilin-type processing-associated H-X9-DG protein